MKVLKLLLLTVITGTFFTSCIVTNNEVVDRSVSLEEVVSNYDLWYVDYHRTKGAANIPFVSRAFTLSFLNGRMYANNNITDIGKTGKGLGVQVGSYNTHKGFLEATHRLDGSYDFDVVVLSNNEIRIDHRNTSYYLIGYQVKNFDYDKLFYENIEYFLQEYVAWQRIGAKNGKENPFDNERFLKFTPKNNTTFYSSRNSLGTNIDIIKWNFVGAYKVEDINGHENLKYLTLSYNNGDTEAFELRVVNDGTISLYHINSKTTYTFSGRGFVLYSRGTSKKKAEKKVRNNNRKRVKITRNKVDRKVLK